MLNIKGYNENRLQTPVPPASIVERPDQAQFNLRISVETETASAALALLKRSASRLEESLAAHDAKVVVTDFDLPAESGKVEATASSLQLLITLPLSRSASAWDRAAKVAQVDDMFRALAIEGKKQKPKLEVLRALPVFLLADPESHRHALIKRFHERARTLGNGHPIKLVQLRLDVPVEQRSIGLEQTELTLRVDGFAEIDLAASASG